MPELLLETFRPTAVLCQVLFQFPVTMTSTIKTMEFHLFSVTTSMSSTFYFCLIYVCLDDVKAWTNLLMNFILIQLLIMYLIGLPRIHYLVLFLKSVQSFDVEAQPILNYDELLSKFKKKRACWFACSVFIVIIDLIVNINPNRHFSNPTLFIKAIAKTICHLPLYLNFVNYLFMLNELEIRFIILRKSLIETLQKIEGGQLLNLNHVLIEKHKFLHSKIINCLDYLSQGFYVILPTLFYFIGLTIIINVYLRLFIENTVSVVKLITVVLYGVITVVAIVHQSWAFGREVRKIKCFC